MFLPGLIWWLVLALASIIQCPDLQDPGLQPLEVRKLLLRKGRAPPTGGPPLTMKVALTPERTAGPEDSSTSGVRRGGEERALPS